jgi:hypothetical protein
MKQLFLGDFSKNNEEQVREHLVNSYEAKREYVDEFDILVAYEDNGGYEGYSFFLLRNKATGEYWENHASHCSCYGFEGQFTPEKTSVEYLKSDKFSPGYGVPESEVRELIASL